MNGKSRDIPTTDSPVSNARDAPQNGTSPAQEDTIPDGGYGWVIVGCMVGLNAVTWAINTSYGVYTAYYLENNHFVGGSTFGYAWVGGLSVAMALVSAPLANLLSKSFGFRIPLILDVACTCLGQCMAGICHTFAAFLVCRGLFFGLGLGLTLVPSQPLLAHWFDKRLSLAQGIANGGSGLGGLVLSNTTRLALEQAGVKWALVISGLISLVVLTPAVLLFRGRHKAVGARSQPHQLSWLWHPGFLWLWLWGALAIISYFVALYPLASFATGGLGLSQTKGAALQSILSAGQMIGRPSLGLCLDRLGRVHISILAYIVAGGSCLVIWLPAPYFGVLIFFALVPGLVGGAI